MIKKLTILLLSMMLSTVVVAGGDRFTLVIDAGHGGKDAGAVGATSKEKNINLSVALAFGRYVEQNCPSVKVIYTRKTDVFVELQERANIANRNKADLFVSIHTNSVAGSKTVKGFQTYTLGMHRAGDNLDVAKRENSVITLESNYQSRYQGFDPSSAESYIMFEYMQDRNMENSVHFARAIQTNVCRMAARQDKGVHQAGFLVLRETSMPSCLVELGFISTPDEERQLNDAAVQDQMARGLYQAFSQYVEKYGRGVKPHKLVQAEPEPVAATVAAPVAKAEAKTEEHKEPKAAPQPAKAEEKHPGKAESSATVITGKHEQVDSPVSQPEVAVNASVPVFKIQLLSGANEVKTNSAQFKGLKGVEVFKDGDVYRYTYGSTSDYNEILRLRESIRAEFPQAFVVAFREGQKMVLQDAINEWKKNKK